MWCDVIDRYISEPDRQAADTFSGLWAAASGKFSFLVLWFEQFFRVMLLMRLYDASCVLQVRGGAPLVWTVEGICGDRRPELVVIPRSDRQHRAVWGSVNASLTPHDVITANSSSRLLHLLTCLLYILVLSLLLLCCLPLLLLLLHSSDLSLLFASPSWFWGCLSVGSDLRASTATTNTWKQTKYGKCLCNRNVVESVWRLDWVMIWDFDHVGLRN